MVIFPVAKINIGLYVTDKRTDGYHNIETLFYPIGFSDILEVVPADDLGTGVMSLKVTGRNIEGSADQNLVTRAYRLLHERVGLPGIRVFLHKLIPSGAGLGGGSSDGAHMLKLLNTIFGLGLSRDELMQLALELGSDCPFFIEPVPSFARGRGELLSPASLSLKGYHLLLFHPGHGISTAEAYRHVSVGRPDVPVELMVGQPVEDWSQIALNVFEPYAFEQLPVVRAIRDELYASGAVYAAMTGSGSAVYGLFEKKPAIPGSLLDDLVWQEQF